MHRISEHHRFIGRQLVQQCFRFAMLAASAFGTNVGDLWAEILFPGRAASLASLLCICVAAVWYHRGAAARTERVTGLPSSQCGLQRPTSLTSSLMTWRWNYALASVLLGLLTLIAARFTDPDFARSGSPRVDAAYWTAMFIAGVFGTVPGDLIHHNIGLYNASAALCLILAGLVVLRESLAPLSMLLFWSIVMAERCAGTAVGDALASRRAVGLGILIASVCTAALTIISLWVRAQYLRRWPPECRGGAARTGEKRVL
jgi:uncharacterized membrane-anchored protein